MNVDLYLKSVTEVAIEARIALGRRGVSDAYVEHLVRQAATVQPAEVAAAYRDVATGITAARTTGKHRFTPRPLPLTGISPGSDCGLCDQPRSLHP